MERSRLLRFGVWLSVALLGLVQSPTAVTIAFLPWDRAAEANLAEDFTATAEPPAVDVGGTLSGDSVWTNDRIYIVIGDVEVPEGGKLTVWPGATVKFKPDKRLIVWGTLIADGTPTQPILFTSNQANPAAGDWDRIYFGASSVDASFDGHGNYVGGSILRNSIVEYGNDIYLDDAAPYIAHNSLSRMGGRSAISGGSNDDPTAQPVIAYNTLVGTGIELNWNVGRFTILGNTVVGERISALRRGSIIRNSVSGAQASDWPFDHYAGIIGGGEIDLIANRVVDSDEGIVVNTNGLISGNLVANNRTNGLRVLSAPTVVSNTIISNGGAGFVADSIGPPIVHHNNLIGSQGQYALRNNNPTDISGMEISTDTRFSFAVDYAGAVAGRKTLFQAYLPLISR